MRFGQISPNLSAKTESSVKNLIAARNMKNQAMRGIVGFVNKAADEKIQKEKDADSLERATALLTQVQAAFPNNAAIQGLDTKALGKEFMTKEGVGIINMLAQADLTRTATAQQALANAERAATAKLQAERLRTETAAKEQLVKKDEFNRLKGAEFSNLRASVVRDLGGSVKDVDTLEGITPSVVYDKVLEVYNSSPDEYKNLNKEDFSSLQSSVTDRLSEIAKAKGEARQELGDAEMTFSKLKDLYFDKKINFVKGLDGTKETLNSQDRIKRTAGSLKTVLEQYVNKGSSQTLDQFIESKFRGSEFRGIIAKVKALGGQVGASQLIAMRRNSRDGSSGFGQLTQAELTLLQNLFGALTDESGELVPADVLLETVKEIEFVMEKRMDRTKRRAEIEFSDLADSYEIYDFESFLVPDKREGSSTAKAGSPDEEKPRFTFSNGQFYPIAFPSGKEK